jgi:hypothetical protein
MDAGIIRACRAAAARGAIEYGGGAGMDIIGIAWG